MEKASCSQWSLQKPLITGWQAIIELPGEGKQLLFRKAKVLPDSLQHDVHNELHSVGEGGIGQLIHHQQEEFSDGPVVLIEALLQGKQHVSDENQRHMSVQRIIGQAVALRAQVQYGLAGFEENFDVPTLAVDPQALLGGAGPGLLSAVPCILPEPQQHGTGSEQKDNFSSGVSGIRCKQRALSAGADIRLLFGQTGCGVLFDGV